MLLVVDNTRQKQLAWLEAIQSATGWTQQELSRRAQVSHSTLSRFRNDRENQAVLDTTTVGRLAAVSPVPHYENRRLTIDGLAEGEAEELGALPREAAVSRAVGAMRQGENALDAWVLRSRALENLGYLPGDVVMVDLSQQPIDGDIVCAQITDRQGNVETAFRLYQRPYLLAASNDRHLLKPMLIDERVMIMGTVVASIRPRQTRLAS